MGTVFEIVMLLSWAVLLVLNIWIFQKGKAQGNLLMAIGAGIMTLVFFIWLVSEYITSSFVAMWLPMIGMVVFVVGFYFTVQPMVQAHVDALKKKIHDVTGETKGGGEAESS